LKKKEKPTAIPRSEQVVALCVSDIHLSHKCPVARSAEPNWYDAMARTLGQLTDLKEQYGDVPILCAGDVFDKWSSCSELTNFAIKNLPTMYAVPGQHDLSLHSYEDIKKTSYWTLVEEGTIINLSPDPGFLLLGDNLSLFGVPWGFDVGEASRNAKCCAKSEEDITVAIIHQYLWRNRCGYPGAPEESNISSLGDSLLGFDAAIFGDNHISFTAKTRDCSILNPGCLIRRKADEKKYTPTVGLLYGDASFGTVKLDIFEDKWIKTKKVDEKTEEDNLELTEFMAELENLGTDSLDFREVILRYIKDNKVSDMTETILLEAMECS